MATDVPTTRPRMPGPVLTAVILLSLAGGLTSLALLAIGAVGFLAEGAFYGDAALPLALLGVLILAMTVLGTVGLVKRNRGAQIVTITIGAIWLIASLTRLHTSPFVSLVGLAAGIALILLVTAPISSRDWFSPSPERPTSR